MHLDLSETGNYRCSLIRLTGEAESYTAVNLKHLAHKIDTATYDERWTSSLTSRDQQFLAFWKLGISVTGEEYFTILSPSVDAASDKYQLRPSPELEKLSSRANQGQKALLGIMLSFYNSERGHRFLRKIRCPNICDLAVRLDSFHREIAAGLLRNYAGW